MITSLHQLEETIFIQRIKELFAGINSLFPTLLIIVPPPCHLLIRSLSFGKRRIGIEQWTGNEKQDTSLQCHSTSLRHSAIPILHFIFRNTPREVFAGNSIVQQLHNKIHCLLQSGPSWKACIVSRDSMINDWKRSVMPKHVSIEHSYHHLCFCFKSRLLLFIHIRNLIYVLI